MKLVVIIGGIKLVVIIDELKLVVIIGGIKTKLHTQLQVPMSNGALFMYRIACLLYTTQN